MRIPTFFIAFFLLLLVVTSAKVNAQNAEAETPSPSPSPESEEVQKRREAKTIAELERDIAKAKKDKLDAEFPKPTSTPLEGKTELDSGVKLESEMLAYRAMSIAAHKIVVAMKTDVTTISALAVHNDRDLKALMSYLVISSQIKLMKQNYADNMKDLPAGPGALKLGQVRIAPIAGLTAAQSFLGSFIDLIALLRTDTSIKGMDFNIEESALVSEVFREMRAPAAYGPAIPLFYPAVFPPDIGVDKQFVILENIEELYLIRERAAQLVTEISETETAIDETKAGIKGAEKKLKDDKAQVALLDKELERLQKIYWRWPSSRLAERIEEVTGQISNLRDEILKLPTVIRESKAKLEDLEQHLADLYGRIKPLVNTNNFGAVVAAVNVGIQKILKAETLLGRTFSTAELGLFLTEFDEATKTALIAVAETHLGHKLSAAEKEQLLSPLTEPERNALHKLYANGASTSALFVALTDPQKADPLVLTEVDRMSLLTEAKQAELQDLKKVHLAQLRALNDQFDKLKDELIKVDNGVGINALTSYLQAENLLDALGCKVAGAGVGAANCPQAYILQLKVIRAGGNNKTTRNLVKDVFTGPSISHSGGTITEYNLYKVTGQSVSSETFPVYSGYVKAKDIPK